jgi:hypothetical protein
MEPSAVMGVFYPTGEAVHIIDTSISYLSNVDIQNRRHGYNTYLPANNDEMSSYLQNKWGIVLPPHDIGPLCRVQFNERRPPTEEVVPALTLRR